MGLQKIAAIRSSEKPQGESKSFKKLTQFIATKYFKMAEEDTSFDPSLKKKKKKKKTPFDLEGALNEGGPDEAVQETTETPEPAKDDNDDIDLENFGKKKKKKKKVIEDEAEEKGDEEKDVPKEDLEDLDLESFGEKKKKKKKKPALNMKASSKSF